VKKPGFHSGVFSAMQYLVLISDQPTMAKEIAIEHGITKSWALSESKRARWEVRKMNKFIREYLEDSHA
jgi:hypothetical protein